MNRTTLGVIVGNRGFFPDHLCQTGREAVLRVLAEEGIEAVIEKIYDFENLADVSDLMSLLGGRLA